MERNPIGRQYADRIASLLDAEVRPDFMPQIDVGVFPDPDVPGCLQVLATITASGHTR